MTPIAMGAMAGADHQAALAFRAQLETIMPILDLRVFGSWAQVCVDEIKAQLAKGDELEELVWAESEQ